MGDNLDLKELWSKQKVSPPNTNDIFSKLNRIKRTELRRLILANVMMAGTSAFIIYIWYAYQPELVTTKIGIILTIAAMIMYVSVYNRMFPSLSKINDQQSNSDYLKNLISIKSKQQFQQTTMLNLYFIMLMLGICLYMYEYAIRMSTLGMILAYGITLAWIAFNWFYIRPRTIRKQNTKLDEMISRLENMDRQLNEGQ